MNNDKYTFKHWVAHHGYSQGSGDFIEVSKKMVWDAIKHDPEFLQLKLFSIRVESRSMGYSLGVPIKTYTTSDYWCKNITEARKIGKVIKQVYPHQTQEAQKGKV